MSITESFEDVLDDLFTRFIMNLPREEVISPSRLGFQLEQAWWFYDDFFRLENPRLPKLNLQKFSERLLGRFPEWTSMQGIDLDAAIKEFLKYKAQVPTCGAILFNPAMTRVLMVKGWNASNWNFPKGKIAKDETPEQCAVREVAEEIGFDISSRLNPNEYVQTEIGPQAVRLYLVLGVPENTKFQTLTRKEISAIDWISISELSNPNWANKSYGVQSFLGRLKAFVKKQKRATQISEPNSASPAIIKRKPKKEQSLSKPSPNKPDRKQPIAILAREKPDETLFRFDRSKIELAFEQGWYSKTKAVV